MGPFLFGPKKERKSDQDSLSRTKYKHKTVAIKWQ